MDEGRAETIILLRIVNARPCTYVLKAAVRLLVIERIAFSGQTTWSTHYRDAAKLTEVLTYTGRLPCLAWTRRQIIKVDFGIPGNEEVEPAIAVVVAPAPTLVCQARFVGYILKFPAAQVTIERRPRSLLLAFQSRYRRAVDQVNVGHSISIIVKDCDATGGRFKDVVL